ncbi:hypothetical protein CR162_21030 [Pseudoroseomonas rhizosphaerae]|uniref:Uncharacterized protein n=1 Tax=Teichococcus rhizosphaerae TaxID=1335062 RepID=A0A2C6ZYT8_9PROT|nr:MULTISPECIES: hypothetical protein [Pseudoroseomonas]PHK92978.1 hypothetical protein CR162_21030 [Pseudoroseomonas rhizosphaerae]
MSKRPLSPLSLGSTLAAKGEGTTPENPVPTVVAPPPQPAPPPATEPRILLSYRPRVSVHDKLRRLSFDTRRSMQEMVDEAVETWLAGQGRD